MIKVLIVDDHSLVRLGIKRLLEDTHGIKVVGEAETGEDAVKFVKENPVDVVLLDVKMPGIGGLEATKRIVRACLDIKIIAVTAFHDDPFPSRILQAGACGYLTKECGIEEMIIAIQKVSAGQRYISPEIAQQLALRSVSDLPTAASQLSSLSERELQVMLMITAGRSLQETSEKLCLSAKTVSAYRGRLLKKLNVKNDVELTYLALRQDWFDPSLLPSNEDDPDK